MSIRYQYCHAYGFDREKIKERLRLFQVNKNDVKNSMLLQELVIQPNSKPIINKFYAYLFNHKEYREYLPSDKMVDKLKKTQLHYLTTLGKDFATEAYFDDRLRVGVAHNRIGMPLSLYECSYQMLRSLILECIPPEFEEEIVNNLRSFVLKVISLDMSLAIDSYMERNIQRLENNIDNLVKREKKLQYWSEIDPLTHILNRNSILNSIRSFMKNTEKGGYSFAIVMIDFDNLSRINDKYGHMVGDLLLKSAIDVIKSLLSDGDKIGRYGGDEFIIVLPHCDDARANEFAKHLCSVIAEKLFDIGSHTLKIGVSYGIATHHENETISEILRNVDRSLLENKV